MLRLFLLNLLISLSTFSQEIVEFSLGQGYQYDIYYSFNQGISGYTESDNWELAFSTNPNIPNVRINSGKSVKLFLLSENINNWDSVSTVPDSAIQLRNSNESWDLGAFVNGYYESGESFTWGDFNYNEINQMNQNYVGSKIFLIEYGSVLNPIQKKIMITEMTSGMYYLRISNLDGTSDQLFSVDTEPYSEKKFIYFSLSDNQLIDREPSNWDIIFTRYEEEYVTLNGTTMPYIVTGALTNENYCFEFNGPTDFNPPMDSTQFSTIINTIGYDWKLYSGSYSIVPDRAYFIISNDQLFVHKIIFQSFDGGQTGNMSFLTEEFNYNPITINEFNSISNFLYPNPSDGIINSLFLYDVKLEIRDLSGRLLLSNFGPILNVDLSSLNNGHYVATITANDDIFVERIIVSK